SRRSGGVPVPARRAPGAERTARPHRPRLLQPPPARAAGPGRDTLRRRRALTGSATSPRDVRRPRLPAHRPPEGGGDRGARRPGRFGGRGRPGGGGAARATRQAGHARGRNADARRAAGPAPHRPHRGVRSAGRNRRGGARGLAVAGQDARLLRPGSDHLRRERRAPRQGRRVRGAGSRRRPRRGGERTRRYGRRAGRRPHPAPPRRGGLPRSPSPSHRCPPDTAATRAPSAGADARRPEGVTRHRVGLRGSQDRATSEGGPAPAGRGRGAVNGGRAPWLRKLARLLVLPAILGAMATAGCGASHTSLSVTLGVVGGGTTSTVAAKPTIEFAITVLDTGTPGTAVLTAPADLPADFRYTDTVSLGGTAVRTSPVDAQGKSQQPTWGVWELSGKQDDVKIQFDAIALGSPGTYTMTASASASTATTTESTGLLLKLTPAPQLSALVTVSPSHAVPGADVTYRVTVINQGTGPADDVSVLVTLPPVFIYDGSVSITGNSGRIGGTDPLEGSTIPYFARFVVPAENGSHPGKLTIDFHAQVLSSAGAQGTYPVGVQVLGDL